ncbi:MAG TPA: DNA polymerase I, partial [Chthonomonadales bacterium]|nr:DNA polymerase I [Chthonomonadales bacterium]
MQRTLYLIDAYAQIFRAYYALRGGMRSPITGEPTHAIYGFTAMLLKLLSQYQPDFVAVAIDTPGKTFRDELYSDYKATRAVTPDDLTAQVPRIFDLISRFGIPVVGCPGLEADDIIATITDRVLQDPACNDIHVRIISKDKDLEQLLCDRVTLFDIHTEAVVDVATLWETKGIRPEQVVDVLALTGDTVDNVPGVEGIGPKTATQLIQQFGSLEGIFANLDQIKGKRRESLQKARETLALSRVLLTLKREPELSFDLEAARIRPPEVGKVLPLFQELGFRRFQDEVRRLALEFGADKQVKDDISPCHLVTFSPCQKGRGRYRAITTEPELRELVEILQRKPIISLDTETTRLGRDADLCGLSFAWTPGEAVYVPVISPNPGEHLGREVVLAALRPVLEDPAIGKCGHNLKFDAAVLQREGAKLRGARFDSMLASALLDPGQTLHKLDDLALARLNYQMIPITELIGDGFEQASMADVPLEKMVPYAAEDADIALRLYHALAPELEAMGMNMLMSEVEAPLTAVLAEMERNGILCDPVELARQREELRVRVEALREQIRQAVGCDFNLDSPRQLQEVLFDKLGLASGKRTKTGRSTDIEVLEKLAAQEDRNDPRTSIPRLIIEYRQLNKLINTYLGNLRDSINPKTGRIHSTFHQLVTATGRLASHGPNLQNIPVRTDVGRQIRRAFRAAPGYVLLCADYSQIELRILAHLSADEALVEAFRRDLDIHTAVAAQVFGVLPEKVTREQRDKAKTINFGIIYGVTPY